MASATAMAISVFFTSGSEGSPIQSTLAAMKRIGTVVLLLLGATALAQEPAAPTDDAIRQMLAKRIDVQKQARAAVVGRSDARGRQIVAYGKDRKPLDGDSVFEIASLTKVLTALVLSDMVGRGEVGLMDSVTQYLPERVLNPDVRAINLVDLATHSSGFPRRLPGVELTDTPYDYGAVSRKEFYAALATFKSKATSGSSYEYSNFGYAVLGEALAHRAEMPFERLLETRVLTPLGMDDTRFKLTQSMRERAVTGHDITLAPIATSELGMFEPSGGLYSTVNDMLDFLEVASGRRDSPLSAAARALLDTARTSDYPYAVQALGWRVTNRAGHRIAWSNGSAQGFRTFMGFSPKTGVAVVAFANASSDVGVDDIGRHLIDDYYPMNLQGPDDRKEITLAPAVLDRYVGKYLFRDKSTVTIVRDGSMLVAQWPDGTSPLFAEAETSFFMRDVDAQVSFSDRGRGNAKARTLTLHQNKQEFSATRIE
jgi:D-alanyl-D-alanine-carboxypeptidase/D-alanyl-D-alanine-endopeptidase